MNNNGISEGIYQNIGKKCLEKFPEKYNKILIYAEVSNNSISTSLFTAKKFGSVRYMFCPENIESLIYELWERNENENSSNVWRGMCFFIEEGNFEVNFVYQDQINLEDSLLERRELVLDRYFPSEKIDYSKPEDDY